MAGRSPRSICRKAGCRAAFPKSPHVALIEGRCRGCAAVERGVGKAVKAFGRLDGLVSNAGIMKRKPIGKLVARRLATRDRRQPDRFIPVRPRGREAFAQSQGRDRHHRLHPRADVGAQYRSLFGDQGRAGCADACAVHEPWPGHPCELHQPGLDRDRRLPQSCARKTTTSIPPAASASRTISRKWRRFCWTASGPDLSPAPILWWMAA